MRISDLSSDVCSSDLAWATTSFALTFSGYHAVSRVPTLRAHRQLLDTTQERHEPGGELGAGCDAEPNGDGTHRVDGAEQEQRSAERRVGKECERTWKSRGDPYT